MKENNNIKKVSKKRNFFYLVIKRIFDILCSIIGIILIIPLALIVKISYILTGDFSSIFYTQKRIGLNGKEFKFYKFRTMIPNADIELERLLKEDEKLRKEYKENKKLKNDPRITKMGKVLRNSSLDELPQIINVLIGNMSLIGNRPYLPREKDDMGKYYDTIITTKPGITGYWQVNGRSDVSFNKRLELEEYYSKHYSLGLDIKILFKTFSVVVLKKGAK